jgi:cell division protein DivIC
LPLHIISSGLKNNFKFGLQRQVFMGIIRGIGILLEGGMIMEHKKPARRRFNWFMLLMGGVIIYFSSILVSQQVYLHQVSEDQAAAEARLAAAKQENDALLQEKENLNKPEYIEKTAREELGMTRHGELPYSTGRK